MESKDVGRRDFLKKSVLAGASIGSMSGLSGAQDSENKPVEPEKEKKVPRRELGGTGKKIPILLFGCSQAFDPKYDKMLHRGFKEGVDYLDTALVYERGQSHKTLAPFVKQVKRENVWITSKGLCCPCCGFCATFGFWG